MEKETNLGRPKAKHPRTKQINIRLTEEEHKLLLEKTEKINRSKFIADLIKSKEIKIIDPVSAQALQEIRKIGNNINQIAFQLNQKKEIYPSNKLINDFNYLKKELYQIKKYLFSELNK